MPLPALGCWVLADRELPQPLTGASQEMGPWALWAAGQSPRATSSSVQRSWEGSGSPGDPRTGQVTDGVPRARAASQQLAPAHMVPSVAGLGLLDVRGLGGPRGVMSSDVAAVAWQVGEGRPVRSSGTHAAGADVPAVGSEGGARDAQTLQVL